MSDLFNQNKTKYVIDTSTFIQMDRMYPKDIFQSLWLNLENSLKTLSGVAFNGDQLSKIEIDDTYPEYILKNLDNYKHLIL